jgi:Tripartite tricarboxylate transporter TctB family
MRIKSQENFWAGLMFIAFGVIAILVARDYPMGSAMRMGPGYFPTYIGVALVLLGALITASGFKVDGERIGVFPWRAILLLSVAFAWFAWGIDNVGFILALAVLIVLASFAGREQYWKEVIVETVVLIVGCWLIFIVGIELPYPLFWER